MFQVAENQSVQNLIREISSQRSSRKVLFNPRNGFRRQAQMLSAEHVSHPPPDRSSAQYWPDDPHDWPCVLNAVPDN